MTRNQEDDAKARAWAKQARKRIEAGDVRNDSEFRRRKQEEVRNRLRKQQKQ